MVRATIFDIRVKVLIDSSAEIYLISRKITEVIGLLIRTG